MHVHVHTLGMSVYTWVCVFDMLMFSFCAITDAVVYFFESRVSKLSEILKYLQ